MRLVFAKEAREGQNAQEKAERLMEATGHHLEDVIALFGREIRLHCVGHGGPRGTDHSPQQGVHDQRTF